jgi:hypothetical protein
VRLQFKKREHSTQENFRSVIPQVSVASVTTVTPFSFFSWLRRFVAFEGLYSLLSNPRTHPSPASDSAPLPQSPPSTQISRGSPPCAARPIRTRLPSMASWPHAPCSPGIFRQIMHSSREVGEDWEIREIVISCVQTCS